MRLLLRDRGLQVVAILGAILVAAGIAFAVWLLTDDELPTIGPSMRPTLSGFQTLEIDESAYEKAVPAIGDVVVVQAPQGADSETCGVARAPDSPCAEPTAEYSGLRVVKRVVAAPGDRVAFAPDGTLIRDGERMEEEYIRKCPLECGLAHAITVPADHWFLAGDNRPVSADSREFGPVPTEAIDARVLLTGAAPQRAE